MIKLPQTIIDGQPTGAPETLRVVPPTITPPPPTDPRATAHAVGAHVIRLPRGMEARAATIDNVPVLFARRAKAAHVFCDSAEGVVEVVGFSAEQIEAVHEWLDAAAVAPQSELEGLLERISARFPERRTLDPKATDRDTRRALKIIGLSADEDRAVDRYLALAAELDDGAASGDSEVDRLAKLGDSLGER